MLSSFIIAFSMYSKIPMPNAEWSKKNMRYAMCFFPFVGLLIGCIDYLFAVSLLYLKVPSLIIGLVLSVVPVLITGGIHIDGLLDTIDAVMSYKTKEEKIKILDDPHVGSFAVIYGCIYIISFFVFSTFISRRTASFIGYVFVISRILSGISVITFPKAKDGIVKKFSESSDRRVLGVLIIEFIFAVVMSSYFCGLIFLIPTGVAVVIFLIYYFYSKKTFGGTSGDLAGAFVCIAELFMIITLYVMDSVSLFQ